MLRLILLLIMAYKRVFSPFLGNNCRFFPSCSTFTQEAIEKHGWKGLFTGIKRLLKCHPFNKGGYDPLTNWIK